MVLIMGGSGAYFLKEKFGKVIERKRFDTPFGLSNPIYRIKENGTEFLFMSRHGERDYELTAPFVNYRANIYAAKLCGASRIISWTGPGSMKKEFKPGDFVVPNDLIDFTKKRNYTFFEGKGLGFVRQSPVFCPEISQVLRETLEELHLSFHYGATYVCTEGPRLETPAEIEMFKKIGADLVGMTVVPEVFLAKELEMCYATLCYVTNYAEGIENQPFKSGILFEGMLPEEDKGKVELAVSSFPKIMVKVAEKLTEKQRKCHCKDTMKRYRLKGMAGTDWKEWIV